MMVVSFRLGPPVTGALFCSRHSLELMGEDVDVGLKPIELLDNIGPRSIFSLGIFLSNRILRWAVEAGHGALVNQS